VLKWLCGGPGGSFLYASPETTSRLTPSFTGWQAHERPFAFERDMDYADHAWKWLNGTPPIPALYAAIEGPRIVRRAGIERVREKSVRQTSRLIELADARGYRVTAPRDTARRGGTVAFDVPHSYGVAQALLANDVIVDYRPNAGIRVAPHFYTSDDELTRAVEMIDEILRDESWKPFEDKRGTVT
jgi:kynureninase